MDEISPERADNRDKTSNLIRRSQLYSQLSTLSAPALAQPTLHSLLSGRLRRPPPSLVWHRSNQKVHWPREKSITPAFDEVRFFLMPENSLLEERLTAVERDLAELRDHVLRSQHARPWFERMIGSMKHYPEFAEVVKLGREIRKMDTAQ